MALALQEIIYTTEMVKRALRPGCEARISQGPEIKAIAPQLISAMTDGAQPLCGEALELGKVLLSTSSCVKSRVMCEEPRFEHITRNVLDKLLATSFVHHIDAPSLSLVPRRSRGTRRMENAWDLVGVKVT